jgi:hypothetical protein
MPEQWTFGVRWISANEARAADFDTPPDATVEYSGRSVTVRVSQ